MAKYFFYLFLIAMISLPSEAFAFKMMTFNVWTGKEHKKKHILAIIKKANPDIIVINEANHPQVFNDIADALNYHRILAIHNTYNVGILSKFPIETHQFFFFKEVKKSLVEAQINVPELDKPLYLFACHLTALNLNKRVKKRKIEIDIILEQVKKRLKDHYVILAGDMNEESHLDRDVPKNYQVSRTIASLGLLDSYRTYHTDIKKNRGFTHVAIAIPTRRLDYIYGSPALKVIDSQVLNRKFYRSWPSDHAAVITEYTLVKAPPLEDTTAIKANTHTSE